MVAFSKPKRKFGVTVVVVLLSFSALLDGIVALKMSATTDELHHLRYGAHILHFRPDRTDGANFDSQMPVSALNAAPQFIALSLERHGILPHAAATLRLFRVARFPTIVATLALTVMVCWWVYDLYGIEAAIASCLLCMLSPNLVAHGTLSTTDMYYALGVVGSLFFFRRYVIRPSLTNAIISGLTLALVQISKSFALSIYLVVAIVLMFAIIVQSAPVALKRRDVLVFFVVTIASFLAVVNTAYWFYRPFVPLNSYRFQSMLFSQLQEAPLIRQVPVPTAYPVLQGLDMMKHLEETGEGMGNIYLLGTVGDSHDPAFTGFKSYYAVAWFFKEPIALQILFLWGLIWILRHRKLRDVLFGEGILLGAAALLVFWVSFFSRAQIGIRHILPALAIEIVIASAVFSNFSSMTWPRKTILLLLVLWLGVSFASYYPHMIPYMNEWVRDRRISYKFLADSNLDWGQDLDVVAEFMRKNSDVILNPSGPVAGRILVGANSLTGVDRAHPSSAYLASRYHPVAHVGYAHFLFLVREEDLASLKAEPAPPHDY